MTRRIETNLAGLSDDQQKSVQRQAQIGWFQTGLLPIVFVQIIFAGLLRALPPEIRASLSFLHRIEWGAYVGIVLILAQVAIGWPSAVIWTNRFSLLAWRFGGMHSVTGNPARRLAALYLVLVAIMVVAVIWVNQHGFVVNPR